MRDSLRQIAVIVTVLMTLVVNGLIGTGSTQPQKGRMKIKPDRIELNNKKALSSG